MGAWTYCSCGHTTDEHAAGGKCRAKSLDGWPCECPAFDDTADSRVLHVSPISDGIAHDTGTTEPDCVCGPTIQPVPGTGGSMGWLIVHHSLDGRELTETTA